MVTKNTEMYIFIHLCVCDGFVDTVKNYLNIHLATIIERESNCNVKSSVEEHPFLHIDITRRKISGWDLKITIPVNVNIHAVLKERCGYFYQIMKHIYREKWIAQHIKTKTHNLLSDCFYRTDFVAFTSTSIKEVRVTSK